MSIYDDVKEWHKACGLPVGTEQFTDWRVKIRRHNLILEEVQEIFDEWNMLNREKTLDGILDKIWVLVGTLVELGWDFEGAWAEVKRSNWSKVGAGLDGNGKLEKGPNFSPPDLARFARRKDEQ